MTNKKNKIDYRLREETNDYKLIDESDLESFLNQNRDYEPVNETIALFKLYGSSVVGNNMNNFSDKIVVRKKTKIKRKE